MTHSPENSPVWLPAGFPCHPAELAPPLEHDGDSTITQCATCRERYQITLRSFQALATVVNVLEWGHRRRDNGVTVLPVHVPGTAEPRAPVWADPIPNPTRSRPPFSTGHDIGLTMGVADVEEHGYRTLLAQARTRLGSDYGYVRKHARSLVVIAATVTVDGFPVAEPSDVLLASTWAPYRLSDVALVHCPRVRRLVVLSHSYATLPHAAQNTPVIADLLIVSE
ncbi:hypothetical protein ACWCQN_38060 [Streptomyces sp. NPDC001984]